VVWLTILGLDKINEIDERIFFEQIDIGSFVLFEKHYGKVVIIWSSLMEIDIPTWKKLSL
jgi:hypothetical protein